LLDRDALWCGTPLRQAEDPLHFGQIRSPAQELKKACWQQRQLRGFASKLSTWVGFLILMACSVSLRLRRAT